MKILVVSPFDIFPPNTGGMSRIYCLAKYLSRRHEITLACPDVASPEANDLPVALEVLTGPGRLQFINPRYVQRLRSVIRRTAPDLIISSFIWPMAPLALARWPRAIPIYLDTHNVESDRFRLAGSRWWRMMALYERLALRLAARVYVVSDDDRRRLEALGMPPEKGELAPNGYDDERFRPDPVAGEAMRRSLGVRDEELLFLYFGHLQYAPNVEGLEILHREIMPRLDRLGVCYRLAVAGRGSSELAQRLRHPSFLFAGVVDHIEELINAADATVAPVLRGGGTRIKIIESIACGRRVVSTPEGAEGLDRAVCDGLLDVVDGWDSFAGAMAATPRVRGGGAAPPPAFREEYAWSAIVARMGPHTAEIADAVRAR